MIYNKVRFSNFKAFGENVQTFSEKPITLIYGPNSIGKSSLIHLMAYRDQILRESGNFNPSNLDNGDIISLVGFSQFVHKKDLSNVITLSFNVEYTKFCNEGLSTKSYIETKIGLMTNTKIQDISNKYIVCGEEIITVDFENQEGMAILNLTHPIIIDLFEEMKQNGGWTDEKIEDVLGEESRQGKIIFKVSDFEKESNIKKSTSSLFLKNYFENHNLDFDYIYDLMDIKKWTYHNEQERISLKDYGEYLRKFSSGFLEKIHEKANPLLPKFMKHDSKEKELKKEKFLEQFPGVDRIKIDEKYWKSYYNNQEKNISLKFLFEIFTFRLAYTLNRLAINNIEQKLKMVYFGPLRFYPERDVEFKENNERFGSKEFWSTLQTNKKLRKKLNIWLENDKLNIPYVVKFKKKYDLTHLFEQNMDSYTKGDIEKYSTYTKEINFEDKRTGTLVHNREMGLGVTQLLPIIATSLIEKNTMIFIEQPELHLHPKVQCEIADEFIRSYKEQNNHFLIETHSEHILLRIMKRMRHTVEGMSDRNITLDLTPSDVCVLYVDNDGESTYIQELRLSSKGKLLDHWPNGFFEEGFKERFS